MAPRDLRLSTAIPGAYDMETDDGQVIPVTPEMANRYNPSGFAALMQQPVQTEPDRPQYAYAAPQLAHNVANTGPNIPPLPTPSASDAAAFAAEPQQRQPSGEEQRQALRERFGKEEFIPISQRSERRSAQILARIRHLTRERAGSDRRG